MFIYLEFALSGCHTRLDYGTVIGWLFGFRGISTVVGARGVMVIVAGCGHDDTSSNPGRA